MRRDGDAWAGQGRRVVFYDQLGGGDSDRPDDPSLWTVETFLDELRTVREALGLERLLLFGSSWGGMLALEYALTRPEGLIALVLNSTPWYSAGKYPLAQSWLPPIV